MTNKRGSYLYDELQSEVQATELERLYKQASELLDIERQIWSSLGIGTGNRVLDIGCGSGVVTKELAHYVYPGEVTGVDISQNLLEKSDKAHSINVQKDNRKRLRNNISFQQGEVSALPFSDSTFDVVYARLLFQHLSNPLKALSSIRRVLKPGGLLCVLDIDNSWTGLYPEPKSSIALERKLIEKQLAQGGDPWVGRKLGHYLKSANFSEVKTDISIVDSDRLGLANFFGMLSFGNAEQDTDSEFIAIREQAHQDIQCLLDNSSHTWAGFALFTVTGRKSNL